MSSEISRKILALSEQVGALKYGDFTLASGAKSSYYFDGRLISLHPEGAYLLGKAFLQSLAGSGVDAVGGPATAAIPIVTAVALVSQLEGQPAGGLLRAGGGQGSRHGQAGGGQAGGGQPRGDSGRRLHVRRFAVHGDRGR